MKPCGGCEFEPHLEHHFSTTLCHVVVVGHCFKTRFERFPVRVIQQIFKHTCRDGLLMTTGYVTSVECRTKGSRVRTPALTKPYNIHPKGSSNMKHTTTSLVAKQQTALWRQSPFKMVINCTPMGATPLGCFLGHMVQLGPLHIHSAAGSHFSAV